LRNRRPNHVGAAIRESFIMGTIIEFPADAASRRQASGRQALGVDGGPRGVMGTVLILPVIRIERQSDETSGGRGPEEGTAPGRRRRRR
jgi:hypothetical protein